MLRRSARLLARTAENVRSTAPPVRNLDTKSLVLRHDPEKQEFYFQLENGRATVSYELINNKHFHFTDTEVPEELRGKGIGEHLAKAVLDYAVEKNLNMKISCTFLQHYLSEHINPEYVKRIID